MTLTAEALDRLRDLPVELREGLRAYCEEGRETGSFLRACLENDFVSAACRAGDAASLPLVARWLYNHAPGGCHGSAATVRYWIGKHAREREAAELAMCPGDEREDYDADDAEVGL